MLIFVPHGILAFDHMLDGAREEIGSTELHVVFVDI